MGELLELTGVSLLRSSWRGCLSPCRIRVEDVAPLMLGDRGRTPTHIEIAVGTRVVESSYKGTWDIMECWKHSLPTPQQCFAAVGSINLENSTGGFVGA